MASGQFDLDKRNVLFKLQETLDKSPKGTIDELMLPMIDTINRHNDFVTTSTCSGRISVFCQSPTENVEQNHLDETVSRKTTGKWLIVSHEIVQIDDVYQSVQEYLQSRSEQEAVLLKMEPMVMHVQCRTTAHAQKLVHLCKQMGFRESGVSAGGSKIMAEIRTTSLSMEIPLILNRELIIPLESIRLMVEEANHRLEQNIGRLTRLHDAISGLLHPSSRDFILQFPDEQVTDAVPVLIVTPDICKRVKTALESMDMVDKAHRIAKIVENGVELLGIPISLRAKQVLELLCEEESKQSTDPDTSQEIIVQNEAQELREKLSLGSQIISMRISTAIAPASKVRKTIQHDPMTRLKSSLESIARAQGFPDDAIDLIPDRLEWLVPHDVVLLPQNSLNHASWISLGNELWKLIATNIGCSRIIRKSHVDCGPMRQSRAELLYGESSWVEVHENGIIYAFDACRTMFSKGNVTEKKRIVSLGQRNEIVVDFYAGIGYYTLPLLIHSQVGLVHAFEINPDSLSALHYNLAINNVSDRCIVHPGDNRKTCKRVANIADRILLGLLPSSEDMWEPAVYALKSNGGWLHVHGNVIAREQEDWKNTLVERINRIAAARGVDWSIRCVHLERVKSYAPGVDHLVADIHCVLKEALLNEQTTEVFSNFPSISIHRGTENDKIECIERVSFTEAQKQAADRLLSVRDVIHEKMENRQPFIITDYVPLLQLQTLWSPQFLKHTREQLVSVHVCDQPLMSFVPRNFNFEVIPFSQLIDEVYAFSDIAQRDISVEEHKQPTDPSNPSRDRYLYLRAVGANPRKDRSNFWSDFPTLSSDFPFPEDLVNRDVYFSSVLRISSSNTQLWTHYDVMDNILCQVSGKKLVTIYPPSDLPYLYIQGSSSPILNIHNPDYEIYPLFRHAHPLQFELNPGEILFLPSLWFHNVQAQEPSIALNIFWKHLVPPEDYYNSKDLYGNADPIPAQQWMTALEQAERHLQTLPEPYKRFYAQKGIQALNI